MPKYKFTARRGFGFDAVVTGVVTADDEDEAVDKCYDDVELPEFLTGLAEDIARELEVAGYENVTVDFEWIKHSDAGDDVVLEEVTS